MGTIPTSSLRPGSIFEDSGRKYVVLKYQHIKKGRGQATNRVKVRDLESQSITEMTYTNEQSVEEADVLKQSAQFLYKDDAKAYFMSNQDYSQFELDLDGLEHEIKFLTDGMKVITLYIDGNPVSIEIPKTVELTIAKTDPAVAGNTAQSATKDAELETGAIIKVPLFLTEGEVIRVNTESEEYAGRVN